MGRTDGIVIDRGGLLRNRCGRWSRRNRLRLAEPRIAIIKKDDTDAALSCASGECPNRVALTDRTN